MYYRIIFKDLSTNEERCSYNIFTSKKKALAFANEYKNNRDNISFEIYLSDMKTRIY